MDTSPNIYLTYKLDLIKTLAINEADRIYKEKIGLSLREIRVLRFIQANETISASELAEKLVLDKTLLSKNIAKLEKEGFITRQLSSEDARMHHLSLTTKGEQAWISATIIGKALEKDMFGELTSQEWQNLHHILDKTLHILSKWKSKKMRDT